MAPGTGDERQQELTRTERDRQAAEEVHDEHRSREVGDLTSGPLSGGEI
jgi:hypothetical protein